MHLVSHVEQHSEIIVAKHIDNVISLEKNRMLEWQANVNGGQIFKSTSRLQWKICISLY